MLILFWHGFPFAQVLAFHEKTLVDTETQDSIELDSKAGGHLNSFENGFVPEDPQWKLIEIGCFVFFGS